LLERRLVLDDLRDCDRHGFDHVRFQHLRFELEEGGW
jgi:hypothetical protein